MNTARLRRLREELGEAGLVLDPDAERDELVLTEIDYALRPTVHERRVPSVGAIIAPTTPSETWELGTQLTITRRPVEAMPLSGSRLFADGLSSWLIRWTSGADEWAVFDRPAGSERDLVVLAETMGATIVQRHPNGTVRIVGEFGVLRWEGLRWHGEPPTATWIDSVSVCAVGRRPGRRGDPPRVRRPRPRLARRGGDPRVPARRRSRPGVRAAPADTAGPRRPRPGGLAPLRHALSQVDGAAVFDGDGILRQLGVRLVPSPEAETVVEGLRGMRHTSGRRYSYDDPAATVIVVSEDGPVTVLRRGRVIGTSTNIHR